MKYKTDEIDYRLLTFLYSIGLLWLFFSWFRSFKMIVCPFKLITGLPCPGCGMTRAIILLFQLDITGAFKMSPNVVFVIPFVFMAPIIIFKYYYYKIDYIEKINGFISQKKILIPFLMVESIIWAYNVYRGL